MQFTEVLDYLIKNKYILASQGKYVLAKTFQDMATKTKRDRENGVVVSMVPSKERFIVHTPPDTPVHGKPAEFGLIELKDENNYLKLSKATQQGMDWSKAFIGFITAAQVPARLESNRGEVYSANKYSEDGMKAFRKAMESGVDYGVLVRSTMLYYKSSTRFKKTIGNYMANGDWRTDYEALKSAAIDGTAAIEQHIKQETKDNGHNPYRLG